MAGEVDKEPTRPEHPPVQPPPKTDIRNLHPGHSAQPTPLFTAKDLDDKKAIAQTLLEVRRQVRSIEAAIEASIPLTEHPDVLRKLEKMQLSIAEISKDILSIYTPWAREAFKE